MSASEPQGQTHDDANVQRLCRLGGVSRAGYYRSFETNQPARADADMRDHIQRISLAKRYYGYRRIARELRREGHIVNAKRVLRLMREDNLLCLRDYAERLEARQIAASMSRVAKPHDNAKAESFMKTLKAEEVNAKTYATIEDARSQIGDFIETVYNADRLHSALGYRPPIEFEADLARSRNPNPKLESALSPK